MEMMILFVVGLSVGLGIGFGYARLRIHEVRADARQHTEDMLAQKTAETEKIIAQMKESFGALSLEALSRNTEEFLKLARERLNEQSQSQNKELENKKSLIDQTLKAMQGEMNKVQNVVQDLEKDRRQKFGELSVQLKQAAEQTESLKRTTAQLNAALANTTTRGQWGERMAEDVLRLAGFVEGINYQKQTSFDGEQGKRRRDYTFYLPQNRVVHMDVKFPLDSYLKYLNAENTAEKEQYRQQFLKDARKRVEETTKREYMQHADTLDYVLVFIPNEQVYAFLNEQDQTLRDTAMSKKIILCSPMTLYAILAVIRQAVDNFHLERTAGEILELLGTFYSQWEKFVEAMDKVGRQFETTQRSFQELTGTRRSMLEKPLQKIEQLRQNERLVEAEGRTFKVIENPEPQKTGP